MFLPVGKTYSSVPALTAWGAFESKVPWLERQVLELSFPVLKFLMRDAFKLGKAPIAAERLEFIQQVRLRCTGSDCWHSRPED